MVEVDLLLFVESKIFVWDLITLRSSENSTGHSRNTIADSYSIVQRLPQMLSWAYYVYEDGLWCNEM